MIESSGVVRRIVEEDGVEFVSFRNHDGYFQLPAGDAAAREKVVQSRDLNREISFAFNKEAKILFVQDKPVEPPSPSGAARAKPGNG
ncbi:MAG: hypothetical protein EPN97_02295 [Alphaproteobacteria bacterium]|nr:MAG: hypothetical protein EPN97_02295 [Alphaproteobacteria bacterium]